MSKINFRDVTLVLLSAAICAGATEFFHACEPKDDGSWMLCHWAERTVIGLGGVMSFIAAVRFFVGVEVKRGLSLALIPLAIFTAYLPNHVIMLCRMETMRCHTIFSPAVKLVCGLIVIAALVDVILSRRGR